MGVAGLMTGAGAAGGLETLLARMRAEEVLANQGRKIDLDEFDSRSMDRARTASTDQGQQRIDQGASQFEAGAPLREANVAHLGAETEHLGAETAGLNAKSDVIKGLLTNGGSDVGGPSGGPPSMNSTQGRIRLSAGGFSPTAILGSVDQDNTDEEQYLTAYAKKTIGPAATGKDLSFDQRLTAMKMKPQTVIAQGNLNVRSTESNLRQRKAELDIQSMTNKLQMDEKIPPALRPFMLAEFQNRITKDVKSAPTWSQWLNGESVADPSAQIAQIYADIVGKAAQGSGPSAPAIPPVAAPGTRKTRRFSKDGVEQQ